MGTGLGGLSLTGAVYQALRLVYEALRLVHEALRLVYEALRLVYMMPSYGIIY